MTKIQRLKKLLRDLDKAKGQVLILSAKVKAFDQTEKNKLGV